MDGKGGVKYIDSEWFRSFDKVKAIENSLRQDIEREVQMNAPSLADGETKIIKVSYSPQIIFERGFYLTELFLG
jgi:hypothetical protein